MKEVLNEIHCKNCFYWTKQKEFIGFCRRERIYIEPDFGCKLFKERED